MDGRFDTTITIETTKDGQKFYKYVLDFTGQNYDQQQAVQHSVAEALFALGDGVQPKK